MWNHRHLPNNIQIPTYFSPAECQWRELDGWGRVLRPSEPYLQHNVPLPSHPSCLEAYPPLPATDRALSTPPQPETVQPKILSFDQFCSLTFKYIPPHWIYAARLIYPTYRNRAYARRPLTDQGPTDTEVRDLAHDITKAVKLAHHLPNWDTMPQSLMNKISAITENICPPLWDAALKTKYIELGVDFGHRIADLTKAHLHANVKLVHESLVDRDAQHLKLATNIAKGMLTERYRGSHLNNFAKTMHEIEQLVGKKRIHNHSNSNVNSATNAIPTPTTNPTLNATICSIPNPPLGTLIDIPMVQPALTNAINDPNTHPLAPYSSNILDSTLGPASLRSPIAATNRFLPLLDLQTTQHSTPKRPRSPVDSAPLTSDTQPVNKIQKMNIINDPDVEPNSPPAQPKRNVPSIKPNPAKRLSNLNLCLSQPTTSVSSPGTPRPSPLSQPSKPASLVVIDSDESDDVPPPTSAGSLAPGSFIELKSKVTPLDISRNTEVLLIGDSNLRSYTTAPPGWQVVCIPGLHLTQLTNLFNGLPKDGSPKHIVISAGINDRASSTPSVVTDCIKAAKRPGTTVHFQSINFSKDLDQQHIRNLQKINRIATEHDGVFTIPQIANPVFKDLDFIHHSDSTASKIFDETLSHIASLNC